MPRAPLHSLIWSTDQRCYALYRQDRLVQQVQPGDEAAWRAWLREVSSFAFHGTSGSLNVYLEARSPGGQYWYAYHTSRGRTRKRYLGRTENLRLSRLEETARALSCEQQPAQPLAQGMTLLSGRLAPPPLPPWLVEREPLLIRLDAALVHPSRSSPLRRAGAKPPCWPPGRVGTRGRWPGFRLRYWTIAQRASGSR